MQVIVSDREPAGYEAITVSSTAIGFSDSCINPTTGLFKGQQCKEIFATLESYSVDYTIDTTTPTSAVGHLVSPGQSISIKNKTAIQNFRAIRVTSDATLKVTYFF